jgi:hypothetical protein
MFSFNFNYWQLRHSFSFRFFLLRPSLSFLLAYTPNHLEEIVLIIAASSGVSRCEIAVKVRHKNIR